MSARNANVVLIVEDHQNDAKILQLLFESFGIVNPVQVALNGEEAMAYLQGVPPFSDRTRYPFPAVIFLDLKLPGMDGFELLQWLKTQSELKDAFVVVMSGFGDLESIRRAYALGANSFLVKPCHPSDLENLIAAYPHLWMRSTEPPRKS